MSASFAELAQAGAPPLDALALALAAELRDGVDATAALADLDALAAEVLEALEGVERDPDCELEALAEVLGARHGFQGDADVTDDPDRAMLDLVLVDRRGVPISLAVLYVEVARRAGIALAGVGLPGHFVVGHFGESPPLLLDPFHRGRRLPGALVPSGAHAWSSRETALRMLDGLVASYLGSHDLGRAIRAAELRLAVCGEDREALELELRGLRARLN